MSTPFASGPNPYASPAIPPPPAPVMPQGPLPDRLDLMRSYNYIFENPAWVSTVALLGLVCFAMVIPGVSILLQLLFIGYQFTIVDSLLATQGRYYPGFDFGKLGDYLGRGLWPFLVSLVAGVVLFPVIYIGLIVGGLAVGGIASGAGDDLGPVLAFIFGGVGLVVFLVVAFVAMFYLAAMTLRSGLAQDFASGFQLQWINDFVRRMWVDMILAALFFIVTGIALEMIGLLALCIGLFFVIPLIFMAQAHLLYQLYLVYLSRGGMPVTSSAAAMQPMTGPPGYPPKPL